MEPTLCKDCGKIHLEWISCYGHAKHEWEQEHGVEFWTGKPLCPPAKPFIDQCQERLHDDGVLWSRDELLDWLNDGYRQMLSQLDPIIKQICYVVIVVFILIYLLSLLGGFGPVIRLR